MVEPDAVAAIGEAYDAAADAYAKLFSDSLRDSPLDRAILGAFAELVLASGNRQVADLGCGPGHVTAHLCRLGVDAFGIDASAAMIELARQHHRGLRFAVGSMAAPAVADGALGGVLSRWSIIHTAPADVPAVLAQFHRALAPAGHLLICFSASDGPDRPTQAYDHTVAPAHRWWPDHLAALLTECGLAEVARVVSRPEPDDRRQFLGIQLLARKTQA